MKFPVKTMCKVLRVSKSCYYYWLQSAPSNLWIENEKISSQINYIFKDSHESYGASGMKTELESLGYKVSRPRVACIMKANYLFAKRKRKFKTTTDSNHSYPIAPNLLNQCFDVKRQKPSMGKRYYLYPDQERLAVSYGYYRFI